MKAPAFEYERATSLPHALSLLEGEKDARVIAGGQSLVPMLNARFASPSLLVDIGGLAELRGISRQGGRIRIGALTRHADLLRDTVIAECAPLLPLAAEHIAHPAIRNRGTLGGSLALADPAAELPACMVALDAQIAVVNSSGERRVPALDFFAGMYTTNLADNELIAAVEIPAASSDERFAFDEIARRRGDFAIVGLAARWRPKLRELRIVFFGLTGGPNVAVLKVPGGRAELTETELGLLASEAVAGIDPSDDPYASSAYRKHIAQVLVKRTAARLTRMAA
jgi:aerobic carbon-monoxide dehydrogenase medium subunit